MRMRSNQGPALVSATAASSSGALYVSGALTPYDVEALYDQISGSPSAPGCDVHVYVDLGGGPRNSPELRSLATRVARLQRDGVIVQMHAARGKLTPRRRLGRSAPR
jgi:hypothetical protein